MASHDPQPSTLASENRLTGAYLAEAISGPEHVPAILDRWRPWLVLTALLIAIAYGPPLIRLAAAPFSAPGFRVW